MHVGGTRGLAAAHNSGLREACDVRRALCVPLAETRPTGELLTRDPCHSGSSSVMIRRNVVRTVGFYDEDLLAAEEATAVAAPVAAPAEANVRGEPRMSS